MSVLEPFPEREGVRNNQGNVSRTAVNIPLQNYTQNAVSRVKASPLPPVALDTRFYKGFPLYLIHTKHKPQEKDRQSLAFPSRNGKKVIDKTHSVRCMLKVSRFYHTFPLKGGFILSVLSCTPIVPETYTPSNIFGTGEILSDISASGRSAPGRKRKRLAKNCTSCSGLHVGVMKL